MAVTAQTITLPTQSHSLSVPKTLRKLLSVCKSPLTDPESDASQVGGGYTGKISCQTGLQKRLAASIYGAEDEPQISDVAYYSYSSQPLLQYMENSLMGMEPVFLRPILQALGLPLGEATVNSVVRLVELVARILRKNQYRQLTIDTLIRKLFDEDMDPVPTLASVAARLEPAWELRRGIFALLGTLMMSYQVPDDMEDEFYLLRPRTEWMLGVRKTPDMIHAPIGRFIGYFGRFVPRVSTYGTEERKYEPTEPDTTELRVSTLNAYVLTKLGMVEFIWSDLLSEHLSFDRFSRPRTLKMFRFASFCALNYLPGEQDSLFDRYVLIGALPFIPILMKSIVLWIAICRIVRISESPTNRCIEKYCCPIIYYSDNTVHQGISSTPKKGSEQVAMVYWILS